MRTALICAPLMICPRLHAGTVATDATLGHAGPVPHVGNTFTVAEPLGHRVGSNLFFSLSKLNLDKGEIADFAPGSTGVSNILTRVTGGASSIDGTIRSASGADFYFMNPSGVMFGPDAQLDVGGTFAVVTADYIRLGARGRFDANAPSNDLLTAATPAAFGFLHSHPAPISVRGPSPMIDPFGNVAFTPTLTPALGSSLIVVGGKIHVVGGEFAAAEDGSAALAGVDSAGEAEIVATEGGTSLDVRSFVRLGSINISAGALVGADGGGGNAGPLFVAAKQISLSSSSRLESSAPLGSAGPVTVLVEGNLKVRGNSSLGSAADADSGALTLNAGSISLSGASHVGSGSSGFGNSGNVIVTTSGPLTIDGARLSSDADSQSGSLSVTSSDITIRNNGFLATQAIAAGPVSVTVPGKLTVSGGSFLGSKSDGAADVTLAGAVSVMGGSIDVSDGSALGNEALLLGGTAAVTLAAAGPVSITGGGLIISSGQADGSVGRISITSSDTITLDGGTSASPTGIQLTGTVPPNRKTDLSVAARSIDMRNGASISADSFGKDRAGSIAVVINGGATLANRASISATSFEGGTGGTITLHAATLAMTAGARIAAKQFRGAAAGGAIEIDAGAVTLDGSSSVTASGGGGLNQPLSVEATFEPEMAFADIFLISPIGTRIRLTDTANSGTYGEQPSDLIALGSLSTFVAKDLDGTWTLQAQTAPADPPVNITRWSLNLGAQVIGTSTQSTQGNASSSALTVSRVDPGLTDGRGGNVMLNAPMLQVMNGSTISAGTVGEGTAGGVTINANSVLIRAATVQSATGVPRFASPSESAALGDAGRVTIQSAGGILLDQAAISSSSTGGGNAGGVALAAAGKITMEGRSLISTSARDIASQAVATAGDISISGNQGIDLTGGSQITALATGNGGNIALISPRQTVIDVMNSLITGRAGVDHHAGKNGAQIRIDPSLVILGGSTIDGRASGRDVHVAVAADEFLKSADSQILTDQQSFTINTDVAAAIVDLPAPLLGSRTRLQATCAHELPGGSTFVETGADGVPLTPAGWLPGNVAPADIDSKSKDLP